jgi:hypothetical protein
MQGARMNHQLVHDHTRENDPAASMELGCGLNRVLHFVPRHVEIQAASTLHVLP